MFGILLFGYALVAGSSGSTESVTDPANTITAETEPQEMDYSKFGHSNPAHSRLPCLLCHRRDDNSAKIKFPGKFGHLPCAGCHTQQFQASAGPMCNICHTSTGMKNFPELKSFGARFDHGRHPGVNCATCHKVSGRGGVAKSIPSGASAHSTCFQCHTATSAEGMVSCNVCHQPGRLVRTSEWSIAYKKSFSHAKHQSSNCATCHSVRAGAGRGRQVTAPLVSMHFAPANSISCGGCHNNKRAFGANDFGDCKRCHSPKTFKF